MYKQHGTLRRCKWPRCGGSSQLLYSMVIDYDTNQRKNWHFLGVHDSRINFHGSKGMFPM